MMFSSAFAPSDLAAHGCIIQKHVGNQESRWYVRARTRLIQTLNDRDASPEYFLLMRLAVIQLTAELAGKPDRADLSMAPWNTKLKRSAGF